jgi:hypothetical protein
MIPTDPASLAVALAMASFFGVALGFVVVIFSGMGRG